ncbi:brain protein I3 [Aplysia californica]|uniref:Membrane protein BRI3 n=1 Tax=Aplysia californica TaxID=6500 RepID=A0ABM0ZY64_APLCA|nr:brain protein I3 [Aplysia californica]
MSAPPPPPPSYNESESMQQQSRGFGAAGAYQPSYGTANPAPPGAYPPQGGAPPYPPQGGAPPYPPQGGVPQYPPPAGGYDPTKAAGGYYPPQAGYPGPGMPPPAGAAGSYQTSSTVTVQAGHQPVVLVGGCPACRVGVLEDDYTCCGVLCAILFFPLGILCCLAMRQRRCTHCGAVFG